MLNVKRSRIVIIVVLPLLVGCWEFLRPGQNVKSYQDVHWLLTVCTHSDLIVLPNWEIRLRAP